MAKKIDLGSAEELVDPFLGVTFRPRAENHYERNSGIPVAPHVDIARPTVRQRVENLISRGIDPLSAYVGSEGIEMDVPDDPDLPLTPSEQNYLDIIAADLAEQSPLPDEGIPRQSSLEPSTGSAVAPEPVSSPAKAPNPAAGAAE